MDTQQDSTKLSSKRLLEQITVRGLFGHYDYDLPCPATKQVPNSQFMILYGDNGSGKTTILRLLRAILSPEEGKGHLTFLARTLFREFSARFSDRLAVSATRLGDEIQGGYTLSLSKDAEILATVDLRADEALAISPRAMTRRRSLELAKFLEKLGEFTPRVTFLPEHRRLQGEPLASHAETTDSYFVRMRGIERHEILDLPSGHSPDSTLAMALDRAAKWIHRQVVGASTLGDQSSAQIYAKLIHTIAHTPTPEKDSPPEETVTAIASLADAAARSGEYSRFGLASPVPLDQISEIVSGAPPKSMLSGSRSLELISETITGAPAKSRSIMTTVLHAYINGVNARLNALRTTYDLVSKFVDNINSLYRDVALEFQLGQGFRVVSKKSGNMLPPQVLSSGEQHVLLLMCNTLASRGSPCLVLIDEPELSLNIKWQRRLVQTLLDCTSGSDVQFIAATHSFELLSHYRDNVVKLTNVANGHDYV